MPAPHQGHSLTAHRKGDLLINFCTPCRDSKVDSGTNHFNGEILPYIEHKKLNKLGLSCAKLRANLDWLCLVKCMFASFDLSKTLAIFLRCRAKI